MSQENNGASSGVSVIGLLGVAFVILKLCGVITWSWWLVTLPFWGGGALIAAIILFVLLMVFFGNEKKGKG